MTDSKVIPLLRGRSTVQIAIAIIGLAGVVGAALITSGTFSSKGKDTPSRMGPLEGGTNRQGTDLAGTGIQINGAAECSDLCRDNSNCRAMTFVKHANQSGGICWLKSTAASPTPNSAMVSAVKL